MKKSKQPNTFHLGISMAGAVSAGAYTAGFMDYLLEALDTWQQAKDRNADPGTNEKPDTRIPMHHVVIDAIGGASAGGMVSMISALALCSGNLKPVREPAAQRTGNILYDSWVFLDDDAGLYDSRKSGKTTFEKMLDTDDLISDKGAPSLLNSKPIDRIAERVFDELPVNAGKQHLPAYISVDLRILLTITSLRPLDYKVKLSRIQSKFLDSTPGHHISNHDIVAHFKLNYDPATDTGKYLPFLPQANEPGSNQELLIKATKATGAFPIGLAPRYFEGDFSMDYVKHSLAQRKLFTSQMDIELVKEQARDFAFTGIDGGTINNEPFDEVLRVLTANHGAEDPNAPNYGTVLIDPFPNFEDIPAKEGKGYHYESLLNTIGYLIPTMLNQARNKQTDTYGRGLFKLMAFPRKLKPGAREEREHPPLATGGIGGFAGFLDIEFRKHDYFLGRDNARNFLRGIMMLEYNPKDPKNLYYGTHADAVQAFKREIQQEDGTTKTFLPIIPDLDKLDANSNPNPSKYTVEGFPKFNREAFAILERPIRNRIKAILKAEMKGKLSSWFWRLSLGFIIARLSKKITKWVMQTIREDFAKRGM